MIHYSCKYAPIELFAAFGEEACLLDREEENFERAEALTHANLCCHAKSLIQQSLDKRNVIIMDCCDSLRRVYDVLVLKAIRSISICSIFPTRTMAAHVNCSLASF